MTRIREEEEVRLYSSWQMVTNIQMFFSCKQLPWQCVCVCVCVWLFKCSQFCHCQALITLLLLQQQCQIVQMLVISHICLGLQLSMSAKCLHQCNCIDMLRHWPDTGVWTVHSDCKLPFSTVFRSKLYVGYVKRKKYHLVKSRTGTVQLSGQCVLCGFSDSTRRRWAADLLPPS